MRHPLPPERPPSRAVVRGPALSSTGGEGEPEATAATIRPRSKQKPSAKEENPLPQWGRGQGEGDSQKNRTQNSAELEFRWPIDLRLTVASHGWVHLEPWRWDEAAGELSRTERIGDRLGTVAARQTSPTTLAVRWSGLSRANEAEIRRGVNRWVSGDWDPAAAVAALRSRFPEEAQCIASGAGRLLRCSTFYDDFIKTLLTVNTSWSGTCRMNAALVAEPGGGAFPSPLQLLDYGEERLRGIAKLGFRAPTAVAATRRMLDDGIIDAEGHALEARLDHDYLIGLKGIGPYAAAHCRMLLHDFARIPVDSVVVAHLRERHNTTPAEFIAAHTACGDYLGLAYRLMRLREKFQVARVDTAGAGY